MRFRERMIIIVLTLGVLGYIAWPAAATPNEHPPQMPGKAPPVVNVSFNAPQFQPDEIVVATISVQGSGPYTITNQLTGFVFIASDCGSSLACTTDDDPAVIHLTLQVDAAPGSVVSVTTTARDRSGEQASATSSGTVVRADAPSPPVVVTATPASTPAATTPPEPQPDAYEPNDTPSQAAAIEANGSVDKLTFWPLNDVDFFAVQIKESQRGLTLTVETALPYGLDTTIRLFRGEQEVAYNDDISASNVASRVAVRAEPGTYIVLVQNVAQSRPDFKAYRLTTSLSGAANGGATGPTPTPENAIADKAENNYDFDHAFQIAIGEEITPLNFVCPTETPACGDNDFYWATFKGGYCYVAEAYDLTPGVDTNVIVYGPAKDMSAPWTGNDDAGVDTFASKAYFCLPAHMGAVKAYILVGNVGNVPPPAPIQDRTYKLKVSVFIPSTPVPTPTPMPTTEATAAPTALPTAVPTAAPPPPQGTSLPAQIPAATAADPRSVVKEAAPTGRAQIKVEETTFYAAAPPNDGDALAVYLQGDMVTLRGETYRGWVKVVPDGAVTVGWMWGPDLAASGALDGAGTAVEPTTSASPERTPATTATPGGPRFTPTATVTGGVSNLPSVQVAPAAVPRTVVATPPPPKARTFSVQVCMVPTTKKLSCTAYVEGVRVDVLEAATGRPLATDRTDQKGLVSFTVSVAPDAGVIVVIPGLGVTIDQIPPSEQTVPVYIPEGAS